MGIENGTPAAEVAFLITARRKPRVVTLPSAIATAWTLTEWEPTTATLYDSAVDPYADVGITPEALFDLFSTARSAPTNTYYIALTGNDTTGNGTVGNPWQSIGRGQTAANATGQPAKIFIAAEAYPKDFNFTNNGTVLPTVDTAYIATGGRVISGTFDLFAAPSLDATYTNTYSYTVSNVNRVCNLKTLNRFGNYTEFIKVSTPALCNIIPGSWAHDGTKIYINRGDGIAVTRDNTRVFRGNVVNFKAETPVNLYFGGQTTSDGFDFEGGSSSSCLNIAFTSKPANNKVCVATGCTFKYAGGVINASATGVAINSLHGLGAFFNCRFDANSTDGLNTHNNITPTAVCHTIAVNCSGFDNGRNSGVSCNSFTLHEDCTGADFAGIYRGSAGGSVRNINASKCFLAGTIIATDLGDLHQTGSQYPSAITIDDTSVCYADGVIIDMPAGSYATNIKSGASFYHRNVAPTRNAMAGTGMIATY